MKTHCGANSERALEGIDEGVASMQEGHGMMSDDDPSNDGNGMDRMEAGLDSAHTAIGGMDSSMACMSACPRSGTGMM
jgi:hypothetical protein